MRQFIVFPLLVLLLRHVSSTPLLMLPHCPEGKIWSTLWQRCENLPRPDQLRIVKINEASLIFQGVVGILSGCPAGCQYSSRLGECVCCNKEWNLHWFEYLGKCGRVYGK